MGEKLRIIHENNCHNAIHKDLVELGVDHGQQNASHDFVRASHQGSV
jgi:hypothetical protein